MNVNKRAFLEEFVDRERREGTDAEHCLEEVGSRTEVGDGAEVFDGVALLLERVIGRGRAFEFDGGRVDFEGLLCIGSFDDLTFYDNSAAYVIFADFREVRKIVVVNDLNGFKERTVGNHDETEGFGVADASDPAADLDGFMVDGITLTVKLSDGGEFFHCCIPFYYWKIL